MYSLIFSKDFIEFRRKHTQTLLRILALLFLNLLFSPILLLNWGSFFPEDAFHFWLGFACCIAFDLSASGLILFSIARPPRTLRFDLRKKCLEIIEEKKLDCSIPFSFLKEFVLFEHCDTGQTETQRSGFELNLAFQNGSLLTLTTLPPSKKGREWVRQLNERILSNNTSRAPIYLPSLPFLREEDKGGVKRLAWKKPFPFWREGLLRAWIWSLSTLFSLMAQNLFYAGITGLFFELILFVIRQSKQEYFISISDSVLSYGIKNKGAWKQKRSIAIPQIDAFLFIGNLEQNSMRLIASREAEQPIDHKTRQEKQTASFQSFREQLRLHFKSFSFIVEGLHFSQAFALHQKILAALALNRSFQGKNYG